MRKKIGMALPPSLWEIKEEIQEYAKEFGLDFFETIFEILTYDQINEVAAYGGFPNRYPHWKFGMSYEQLARGYEYGLQTIYEMVINNDPCYAYLLEANSLVDQKTVIAHVLAHCDFFKNNYFFSKTNRKMMDEMGNHAARIRSYIDRFGLEAVEEFLDTCLSLDNLIDYYSLFINRTPSRPAAAKAELALNSMEVGRIKTKEYMDPYINPREYLEEQRRKLLEEKERERKIPPEPVRDVLLFLMDHAPLNPWQLDVLDIIREEAYYFAPQAHTKIMNEGWAVLWHSKIMTTRAIKPSEIIDYADHTSGILATSPGRLNPYKLGVELFRNIKERWDRGQCGKEYEDCNEMAEKMSWDRQLGLGTQKIFEVRKHYNDITFIDEYLTPEFCLEQKLFTFDFNPKKDNWEITSRAFRDIKNKLLFSLTNFGQPIIYVEDSNYKNRAELLLWHKFEGINLDLEKAKDTLVNLYRMWKRPVNIRTVIDEKAKILSYDGASHELRPE